MSGNTCTVGLFKSTAAQKKQRQTHVKMEFEQNAHLLFQYIIYVSNETYTKYTCALVFVYGVGFSNKKNSNTKKNTKYKLTIFLIFIKIKPKLN